MFKIAIWFYISVFFLEMNLMALGTLINPNWPVKGFGNVQILAGTVIVDFLGALSLVARLMTLKAPKLREPIDLRKTLEYWKPAHFIDGPYPQISEFFWVGGFALAVALWALLLIAAFIAWQNAPLPVALRNLLRCGSLLCATGLLIFCASISEYLAMTFVRRLRWRGPPMDQKQLDAWKAANPGAPMPWERGRRSSAAKEKDATGKGEMPGDEL